MNLKIIIINCQLLFSLRIFMTAYNKVKELKHIDLLTLSALHITMMNE
jgi:hypothetical protein